MSIAAPWGMSSAWDMAGYMRDIGSALHVEKILQSTTLITVPHPHDTLV